MKNILTLSRIATYNVFWGERGGGSLQSFWRIVVILDKNSVRPAGGKNQELKQVDFYRRLVFDPIVTVFVESKKRKSKTLNLARPQPLDVERC